MEHCEDWPLYMASVHSSSMRQTGLGACHAALCSPWYRGETGNQRVWRSEFGTDKHPLDPMNLHNKWFSEPWTWSSTMRDRKAEGVRQHIQTKRSWKLARNGGEKITETMVSFWFNVPYMKHRTTYKNKKCKRKYKLKQFKRGKQMNKTNSFKVWLFRAAHLSPDHRRR